MKKIMFEQKRFGLEDAVLARQKTMTRRTAKLPADLEPQDVWNPVMGIDERGWVYFTLDRIDGKQLDLYPQYRVGETVAVAQAYSDIIALVTSTITPHSHDWMRTEQGWNNKMFVKARHMPHQIRITNIKLERLQDITDEDCRKEGIIPITFRQWHKQDFDDLSPQRYTDHDVWTLPKFREGIEDSWAESEPDEYMAETPQVAFAVLIFKLMGRKVWERNPWTWAYEFELVK